MLFPLLYSIYLLVGRELRGMGLFIFIFSCILKKLFILKAQNETKQKQKQRYKDKKTTENVGARFVQNVW